MGDTINLFETGNQNGNTGYTVLTLPTGMLHPTTVNTDDERFLGSVVATISEGVAKRQFIRNSSGQPFAPSSPVGVDGNDVGHADRLWEIRAGRLDTAAVTLRAMLLDHTTTNGQGQITAASTRLLPSSTNGTPGNLGALDLDHTIDDAGVAAVIGKLYKTWAGGASQTWFDGYDIPIDNEHVHDLLKLLADYPYVCEGGRGTDHAYGSAYLGKVPYNAMSIWIHRDSSTWYVGNSSWPTTGGGPDIGQDVTAEDAVIEVVLAAVPRAALLQTAIINDSQTTDDQGIVVNNWPAPAIDVTTRGSKYIAGVELTNDGSSVSYTVTVGGTDVVSTADDPQRPPTWARVNPAGSRSTNAGLAAMDDPVALYILLQREVTVSTQSNGSEVVAIVRYTPSSTVCQVQLVLRDSNNVMYSPSGPNQPAFTSPGGYDTGAYAMNMTGADIGVHHTTGETFGTITLSNGQSYIDWVTDHGADINSMYVDFTPPNSSSQTTVDYTWTKLNWKPEYRDWGLTLIDDIRNAVSVTAQTPGDYESVHMSCLVVQIAAVYGPIRPTS